METFKLFDQYVMPWISYGYLCAQQPISAPWCNVFWTWIAVLILFASFLGVLAMIRAVFRVWWGIQSAEKWAADRERIADPETIAAARWKGDDVLGAEDTTDIAQRARESIERQKLATFTGRP
jgi:hypothetical protein